MVPSQLTGGEMRNLVYALGGLFATLVIGGRAPKKKSGKTPPPIKYSTIQFNCWLCTGETRFDAQTSGTKTLTYKRDCKWCGMENRIEVKPVTS